MNTCFKSLVGTYLLQHDAETAKQSFSPNHYKFWTKHNTSANHGAGFSPHNLKEQYS